MEKAIECEMCSEEFDSADKLTLHKERQHESVCESNKKKIECNMCSYKCGKRRDLICHTRTHTGERPFKCQVSGCEMTFTTESSLKRHIKRKHSDERPFECDFPGCLHTCKTASDLKSHKNTHSEERPYACTHPGCNFRAKIKKMLARHTACIHSETKTLKCPKCKYSTNDASNLSRHMTVHEAKKESIPCSIEGCKYIGKTSSYLKKHLRLHKARLPCPVPGCGYITSKEALENHVKLHNTSKRTFQCPLCLQRYPTLTHLQQHCFVHTSEKPFQCGHCEYEAAMQGSVTRHISRRHANFPFPFVVHLLDDRECLRCKVTLPSAEFVVHSQGHAHPVTKA